MLRLIITALSIPYYAFLSTIIVSTYAFIGNSIKLKLLKMWIYHLITFVKMLIIDDIKIHYDPKILNHDKIILVSNHVNYIDWAVIWACMFNLKKYNISFSLKHSISNLFVIYGYMKDLNFIFLKRNIAYDNITLVDMCKKLKNTGKFVMVLFPEGRLFTDKDKDEVNAERALNRNIKCIPNNTLIPKTTGLELMIEGLNPDCIINCTLKYSNPILFRKHIFNKNYKSSIDVFLEHTDVPNDPKQWLLEEFKIKDRKLNKLQNLFNDKFLNIDLKIPNFYKTSFALSSGPFAIFTHFVLKRLLK